MDANTIMQLVGSLGFPIVCCGALFYQQNKTMKDFTDRMEQTVKDMADKMEKSTSVMSDNLEKNTLAINTLVTTVTVLKKSGDDNG